MNTLKKFTLVTSLGVLALGSIAPVRAAEMFEVTLPNLSTVTAEVAEVIANVVTAQLREALAAPRTAHVRRPPSVSVTEGADVVVVARRLPPIDDVDSPRLTRTAQAGP